MFSPAEQQELIQEGCDGTRASNLDRLHLRHQHQPDTTKPWKDSLTDA